VKHNPFSTRKTTPGKIPYFFRGEIVSCCQIDNPVFLNFCTYFKKSDYQSQIVGGHGTGKTTFLIAFVRFLEMNGHIVNHFTLHDRKRKLPDVFWERHTSLTWQFKSGVIEQLPIAVIDGYEQLSSLQKIRLRWSCRKGRCGLLITTHTPVWRLPVLLKTKPTLQTLKKIIEHLFRNQPDIEPPDDDLCQSLFEQHQGNIRDVLFALYDHYERSE
jgi:hypothetical protein